MKKFNKFWSLLEDWLSGSLLVIGLTMIFYGVIMRYIFNNPITWVDEISKYFIIWGALIGASVALRDDHHIKVDLLFNLLPAEVKKVVSVFANLVGIVFAVFFTYFGTQLMLSKYQIGQRSMDVGVLLWVVYLIFPISGSMLTFRFIERLLLTFRNGRREVDTF